MNIWRLVWKEMKSIREIKQLIFLIITPIITILILGTVLTNVFNGSTTMGDIRVMYSNSSHENLELTQYFNTFIEQANELGITFEPVNDSKDALLKVENNVYVGYVDVSNTGLHYYGNDQSLIESDIVKNHLVTFTERYNLAIELGRVEDIMSLSNSGSLDYVKDLTIEGSRQPSAMDYYAIAMITLIILYSALSAADLIDVERKLGTADRLLASPITKAEIFTGKILGSLLHNLISVIIVVFLCKYMFNVYWGDQIGLVLLILFTEVIFALSLGVGLSYLFKSNIAGSIIMILIQIGAFFGGSYFPTFEVTGILKVIANLFPLTWVNEALLKLIYMNDSLAAIKAMLLNIGFSILLLFMAIVIMRKREGL